MYYVKSEVSIVSLTVITNHQTQEEYLKSAIKKIFLEMKHW